MTVDNKQVINAFNAVRDEIKKLNANFETILSSMSGLVAVAQQINDLKMKIDSLETSIDDLKRSIK
jgi:prefoldin subunit 5